ncbi:beta-lactamase family protein [Stakelama sp. CBK3Z-3]|uniref:Beta-lactamase family protein n=1 Tax=Stakelama flava TaxID=2860338 RepID=A0ABS6XKM8_9SPHN|nr:serine hydrolase domain-containing protein [Stakelama flava]MBW4330767.1 beta-lactamase family protein [Stakelama flava]
MNSDTRFDRDAIDSLLAPYDSGKAPGFAVGVAMGGVPVYRRAVGMASAELPVTLSPSMRMRIGSTTKQFCALAVLLLQEDGLLSIDEPLRRYLPELPNWADAVSLRHLLAHSGGLRDTMDLLTLTGALGKPLNPGAQLDTYMRIDSVNFAPGESWNYCNGGYALLSEVASRVSGLAFGDLLHSRIFVPIGMYDTLLRPLDRAMVPNSASLHVPDGRGGWKRGDMGIPIKGEGGVISTVDDMLRWMRHMAAPTVGSAETWAELTRPHAGHGYGLGLIANRHRGRTAIHHAGGVIGGGCQMIRLPDERLDVIVIANSSNALALYGLADAIIDACVPDLEPDSAQPPQWSPRGTFYSRDTGRVIVLDFHEGQVLMTLDGMTLPTRWNPDGSLSPRIAPTDLAIRPLDGEADPAGLAAIEFGRTDHLAPVASKAHPNVHALAGRYADSAKLLEARIAVEQDGVAMALSGFGSTLEYALRPLATSLWKCDADGAIPASITLEHLGDGILLTSGRTTRLRLDRRS